MFENRYYVVDAENASSPDCLHKMKEFEFLISYLDVSDNISLRNLMDLEFLWQFRVKHLKLFL